MKNWLDKYQDGGKIPIAQGGVENKKVVVFAESPIIKSPANLREYKHNENFSPIQNKLWERYKVYDEKRRVAYKNYNQYIDNYDGTDKEAKTTKKGQSLISEIDTAMAGIHSLVNAFETTERPIQREKDFQIEAQNVVDFYKRTNPNVDVEVLPMYNDSTAVSNATKNLNKDDKIAIFGHKGSNMLGLKNKTLAEILSKSSAENCYMGSCSFEKEVQPFKEALKDKTFHYRPDTPWLGFNPQAKTFDDGMWSRNYKPDSIRHLSDVIVGPTYVSPIKKGTTHKSIELQNGGQPGDVGFSYPRNGAPSNGKHAKKTLPSAQNGQEMMYYREGLDFQPKNISQDGGVVKDNQGYWNPDNHGKVVEIDSNDITMQGVDQPLLGISDAGDVQMMQPGGNYKFKGNKVTEYPVAQDGKTIAPGGIPSSDGKKIIIDNYSNNFDYVLEKDKLYSMPKGGKEWTDISNNKKAQNNIMGFLDKNDYWGGYGSGEQAMYEGRQAFESNANPGKPKGTPTPGWNYEDLEKKEDDDIIATKDLVAPEGRFENGVFSAVFDSLDQLDTNRAEGREEMKQLAKTEIANLVEGLGADSAAETIRDSKSMGQFINIVTNGIKRKWSIYTGKTDDVEMPAPTPDMIPQGVSEYYGGVNKGRIYNTMDAPETENRTFKQQYLPVSQMKFGYRNRKDLTPFESDGMEVTTFHPFVEKKFQPQTTVIAIDPEGNIHGGAQRDFASKQGWRFSPTTRNNIIEFPETNGKADFKPSVKNKGFQQPVTLVQNDDGSTVKGSMNILIKGSNENFYGSVQGGRALFQDSTGEMHLVSGSLKHIKDEFKRIKGDSPYLTAYSVDNGTYARGLSFKDRKFTSEKLQNYDDENAGGGGNGLYIKSYNTPVHKFEENYVDDMPNIRTEEDNSYKKGHALKNEVKNIVLHHTAYENEEANEQEVREQFMTKGKASAHVVIEEDGTRNVYASPEQVTFHAGDSSWGERENVNDFSVGVEFQGNTVNKPLTMQQIESFVEYYGPIAKKYNLSLKDIITHEMIAPGRKPDVTDKEYKRILAYMRAQNLK